MNYNDVSKSVRRIAEKTLTQDDLSHRVIIRKGNTYQAYKDYTIEETDDGWQVTVNENVLLFCTAKVALAWCIAHKVQRQDLTEMMEVLDRLVLRKQTDIDVLANILDNDVPEHYSKAMLVARLMEDINSRQKYKKQLSKYVNQTKYIQIKGTNSNELNRFNKNSRLNRSRRSN